MFVIVIIVCLFVCLEYFKYLDIEENVVVIVCG